MQCTLLHWSLKGTEMEDHTVHSSRVQCLPSFIHHVLRAVCSFYFLFVCPTGQIAPWQFRISFSVPSCTRAANLQPRHSERSGGGGKDRYSSLPCFLPASVQTGHSQQRSTIGVIRPRKPRRPRRSFET